jgi:hypothetical protein
MFKEKIIEEMKEVFKEISFGGEHTTKVLQNSEEIMKGENIKGEEKEGPKVAREILEKVGYNKNIDRICFIIGNHHTPSKIDGIDFLIQWEADLLENLTVMNIEKEQQEIKRCIQQNFKTETGKSIAYKRFVVE